MSSSNPCGLTDTDHSWISILQDNDLIRSTLRYSQFVTHPAVETFLKVSDLFVPARKEPGDLYDTGVQSDTQGTGHSEEGEENDEQGTEKDAMPDRAFLAQVQVDVVPRHGSNVKRHTQGHEEGDGDAGKGKHQDMKAFL